MRDPHLDALLRNVTELESDIDGYMEGLNDEREWAKISHTKSKIPNSWDISHKLIPEWTAVMKLKGEVRKLTTGISDRRFENKLGIPAMLAAAAGTILLIISTVKYDNLISPFLFYPIVGIGLLPFVVSILLNYLILWSAQNTHEKRYHDIFYRFHIELCSTDHSLPIAEARLNLKKQSQGQKDK
jgi:hypothetical protein